MARSAEVGPEPPNGFLFNEKVSLFLFNAHHTTSFFYATASASRREKSEGTLGEYMGVWDVLQLPFVVHSGCI